jgi:hypothetical protein
MTTSDTRRTRVDAYNTQRHISLAASQTVVCGVDELNSVPANRSRIVATEFGMVPVADPR